jgi:hypothetical protein
MKFKIGDKVRINPKSRYKSQGMIDGCYIRGVVISKEEYKGNSTHKGMFGFDVYVKWELKKDFDKNAYRVIDLLPSIEEHRDKQLNIILDGI